MTYELRGGVVLKSVVMRFCLVAVMILCALPICSASDSNNVIRNWVPRLSDEYFVIGGIELGKSSPEYVKSIYGEPQKVSTYMSHLYGETETVYQYGESFSIAFVDGCAVSIGVTANNGLKTAHGIQVGDLWSKARAVYKMPWREIYSKYSHTYNYVYRGAGGWKMSIIVYNGKVKSIGMLAME